MSLSDQIALYTALATVAAITTALQATVALVLISQDDDVRRRKLQNVTGTSEYNRAVGDARRYFWTGVGLNTGAALVNGSVLASWGGIVDSLCNNGRWYLYWPFGAVSAIWLTLIIVAIIFLIRLSDA